MSHCVTDYVTSATNTKLYTAKNTFSEMFRVWQFVLKYNEYRILESGLSRGSSIQRNWNRKKKREYRRLLLNCTKQSPNNARIEYKYPAILYGYLDSWLFCTVKNQLNQSAARATLLYPLCFSRLMRKRDLAEKNSSLIINNSTKWLVLVFWLALRDRQNTAQLVKMLTQGYYTTKRLYKI